MRALKNAFRSLLNSPGFSAVAILTLAICIAANTAIFSVYDRLVLHPISLPNPSTLVAIWTNSPTNNFYAPALSWPRYKELARGTRAFSSTAVSAFDNFTLTAAEEPPILLNTLRVSGAFFRTLGVQPALGRDFAPEEDVPNGPQVCILSHEFWTSRFGARTSLVGEMIQLNGQSWQVVGVLPPQLSAPFAQVQVFAPRVFEISGLTAAQVEVGAGYAQAIARLAPGVTLDQAVSELQAGSRTYREQFGSKLDGNNISVPRDFADSLTGNLKPTFYTLLGAVAFVLLIACANVASLFVGRLNARQKEIAVRQSLGASRASIVWTMLLESVLVSVIAAMAGTALTLWALKGIAVAAAAQLPPNIVFALNWRAMLFIVGVALLCAVVVGLMPAFGAARTDLVTILKDATRGSSTARGGRLRSSLIVAEVALSVVLLVGSSLLLLSFLSLQRTAAGFDPTGVATAVVGVPLGRYPTGPEQADFFVKVLDQLRANPQITHAAASIGLPIAGFNARAPYTVQGRTILPLPQRPLANFQVVTEDYFATLKIPIAMGRGFTAEDRQGAPPVCMINQALAARIFGSESPIGHVLLRGRDAEIPQTIVGVIGDVRSGGLNAPVPDEVYYPLRQLGKPALNITARTNSADTAWLQGAIRTAVAQVDRDQAISFFQSLDQLLSQSLGIQRIVATMTGGFAGLALILAAIGLYSVVAHAVAQRTNEIGIRMALGARPRQVLGLIMGGGLKLVAIGLVLGLAGAWGVTRYMQSLLSNVQPLDPMVYGSVAIFFAVIAAAACFVPSLRASRIDPLLALGDRLATR
jgi:predicted permease